MKNRSQLPDQNSSSILSYEKESVERSVTESFTDCHSDLVTAILETVPFPAFCKDAQGKYTGCNKAFEELLGIRHGEIINKTVYDLGPKEIAGQHFEKDNELYEKPGKQHYEGQVKDKNGNIRDVIFDKATITRPDGAVQGIVGVISDITEQKLTEQKVRRQDKVLNVTLDALTHPFMIIDASDHTIRLANSFATSHYNITPSSKCYEASHGLCEPCCGSEHPCPMEEIRKTGKPAKAEHIHIDSEGRKVYVEVNAYPIFDDNGDLDSIIEYSIDITERKQVIDELEKSREQFMLAVNGSNDGIWDWDLRSNSLYLSAKWKQMIGYEDHELPNMFSTFADRMHPDDSIRVQENLSKYLKGNISTYNIEFRLQHKNGSYVWILARGEALRDKDGVPYRMAGSHTDITEIKQAMEELRLREERLKSLVDILQSRHDSVQEFLDLALNEAMKLTESKIGYIYHYNETRKEFALNTWSRDVMKECSIVQPQTIYKLEDTGIWGEAVRQRKTIIVNDFHAPDPLKKGYPQGHVELHRFMTVPIFKKDKIVAVAGVANKGSEYTGNDTLQLKLLMDSVWNIVSQIAAEEAMCESEEKYRGLFENALSGVSIHEMVRDEEGNPVDYVFLEANDAFERQTGLKVADVLGRRATEVLPGIERASFIERYGEVTLTGNPVIFEEFSEPLQRYYSVSAYRMDKDIFATVFQDITESKRKETYSEMEREILQILNESGSLKESIQLVLSSLKKCIGVDAAGIRLKDGDDFPYIVHDGFSQEFLLNENSLTVHEQDGCLCRDHNGNVKLECTCGLVISGNTDPSSPLFTPGGSCWTNDSFPFLELPSDQDPRLHPRNQCIHQGYASLALVPIRTKNQIVGLLQLNSRRKGIFSLAAIEQLEGIAAHIGEALTRNRAEEALRESEQRFRRLAENADDIIYRYGFAPKRGFTYVSPAATKITGYTPEEHYADPDLGFKLVHPDDRYILEELAKGNDKDRTAVTLRWVRRDGNVIWAEQKNILLYDEEGNLIALEGIARDITERKRMEDELAQSEEKYRLLSNVSFEGIIIHDNGIALEVNEALSSITGYLRDELLGNNVLPMLIHPDDLDFVRQQMVKGVAKPYEVRVVRKDGTILPIEIEAYNLMYAGRSVRVAAVRDITERKRAEKALQEKNEELERYFTSSLDLLCIANSSGEFIRLNPEWEKVLGYSITELEGKLFLDYVHPEDMEATLETISRLDAQEHVLNFENRYKCKDGSYRWIEWRSVPIGDLVYAAARDITDRKRAEEDLEKEKSLLKSLLDSIPDMIFFKDIDGVYLGCNPEFSNFVGRGRDQIIGNTDYDLFSKELADFFRANDTIMLKEGKARHNEEWVDYPGGRGVLLDTLKAPLCNSTGDILGLVGVGRDITDKWYAEQTIRDLNQLNQSTLDSLDANICVLDEIGTIIKTNKSWKDFAIANSADLEKVSEGTNYIQTAKDSKGSDSDLALQFARGIEDVMNGSAENFELEYPCHSPEEERWFVGKVCPFQGTNSFPRKVVVSHINITERKKSEQALQAEEARMRAITESTQDAILMMDPAGDISFWNSAAERIFGYMSGEAIGQNLHLLLAPQRYHAAHKEKLPLFLKTGLGGAVGKTVELEALHKNGGEISVEMSLSSLELSDGWHAVGVMREITERKLADEKMRTYAEEVEKKNKELDIALTKAEDGARVKSEFLANMSHEIRTPMNGVIGMTGLLLDTRLDEEQRHYVETVQTSGEALLEIINDVLDFSKIEAGKLELEILDFDLHSVLDGFAAMLSIRAHDKGLEFICAAEPDVPAYIRGDTGRLQQVLTNLTGNAIKFTHHGEVSVRVNLVSETDTEAMLRFSVRDTGIGIPKNKISLLFNQFYQVDASTTRQYGGTGLGLAISKQLVELMGGEIGMKSEQGKGSEFWFTVRFAKQPYRERNKLLPADIQSARILVVDDNATNREILVAQISSWGANPVEAVDGPMALQALYRAHEDREPFHVAILDMHMPGMDGLTLARIIKSDEKFESTCLIMLSSMGQWSASGQLEKNHFEAYLTKPVRQSELFEKLSTILTPDNEKQKSHSSVTEHATSMQKIKNVRILLAEDNIVNQKVAQSMLKKMGLRVDTVANGAEALKTLQTLPYDLVLMDVQMPEMDGLEATRLIRQPESAVLNRNIPIIAMTAHAMKGDRERFIEAGMDDYISKPVSLKSLMELLDKWLEVVRKGKTEDSSSPSDTETFAKPLIFDREALFERIMDDEELARSLIAIFLKQVPEQIRELRENVDKREMKNILWCSHKIKGTSANLGGMVLSSLAFEMEQAAMQGEYNKIITIMPDMEKQFDILVHQLKEV